MSARLRRLLYGCLAAASLGLAVGALGEGRVFGFMALAVACLGWATALGYERETQQLREHMRRQQKQHWDAAAPTVRDTCPTCGHYAVERDGCGVNVFGDPCGCKNIWHLPALPPLVTGGTQ